LADLGVVDVREKPEEIPEEGGEALNNFLDALANLLPTSNRATATVVRRGLRTRDSPRPAPQR
jgi:hypothetical protein